MKRIAKCGICNKFAKEVPVNNPRSKGEINYICKTHGVINQYVEFENR